MDYFFFFLIIAVLIGLLIFVHRIDNNAKNKYRQDAYTILESTTPDTTMVKKTLKGLYLYGGRVRKDQEFQQLIKRLNEIIDNVK